MSVFTPNAKLQPKVHDSEYIQTQNTPDKAEPTPAVPVKPAEPAK